MHEGKLEWKWIAVVLLAVVIAQAAYAALWIIRAPDTPVTPAEFDVSRDSLFFQLDERTAPVRVNVTLYLTNTGDKDSGAVRIDAFAIDGRTNTYVDRTSLDVGTVKAKKSALVEFSLAMPVERSENYTHKVSIVVLEKGEKVTTFTSSFTLLEKGVRAGGITQEGGGRAAAKSGAGGPPSVPGFEALGLLALLPAAKMMRRRNSLNTLPPIRLPHVKKGGGRLQP